jgi:hypothetical protein
MAQVRRHRSGSQPLPPGFLAAATVCSTPLVLATGWGIGAGCPSLFDAVLASPPVLPGMCIRNMSTTLGCVAIVVISIACYRA